MRRPFHSVLPALVAAAGVFLFHSTSNAELTLRLTQGGNTVTVTDSSDGSLDGVVSFNGVLGVFTLNFTVGTKFSDPYTAHLDLLSVNATTSTNPGNLKIELSEVGFTLASGTPTTTLDTKIDGNFPLGSGNITFQSYVNSSNVLFATTGQTAGAIGPLSTTQFTGANSTTFSSFNPFSMTLVANIHLQKSSKVSFDGFANAIVPEPATMTLALAGVPLVGVGAWLRRRKMTGLA